ncbi:MAG: pyrroline-5-carboxylate reductase [Methanolobus sp.]|jgi:pyrroline-5-carboxylate reductase|uniref:Pyrroline-5-carboxylate reductase n=1 Tax=Methanolobus tindarius DSM 2278 TaxID=1090322 RepID=W9DQQ2_METTI|nr:pyrroline-5-carboxylate reductase [Methanolobus tindarius]ETA67700.1 pyrroline-5-carboxylate reductase [Methanolobus tindarius DSM 2278]MDK2939668.1 pyrroline-5-carboxylate reductase [Methanolobus sp.]
MSLEGKKLGFIGTGKMGSALIKGICNAGLFSPSGVYASDLYEPSLDELKQSAGVNVSTDNAATVINSDIIVLAVKPQILKKVIAGIKEDIGSDKLVISIAAGVKLADIEREFNEGTRVIRVMPNIAATVAEAASAITQGSNASKEDAEDALAIFGSVGSAIQVPENLMDAVTGLSGSGPAYIFPVIEAMADGAVYEGLDRKSALVLAAQTVLGAAKMALETETHPGELKDMVTSPAGTTIRGIKVLEEYGIRSAFMQAVIESSNRSKELGK